MIFDQQFNHALERQAAIQGRELSAVNRAVASLISNTALKAINETRLNAPGKTFKVVSAPTGSSKTNSALAFTIAMYAHDPQFSCAFVVEEVKHAQELFVALSQEIPIDDLGVWTSFHDSRQHNPGDIETYGFAPQLNSLGEVAVKRIAIYTHKKWLNEIESGRDYGVRFRHGKPRDVLFIDEQPQVIQVMEKTPSDILKVRDAIASVNTDHYLIPILSGVVRRMEAIFLTNGNEMEPTGLIEFLESYGQFNEESAVAVCTQLHLENAPLVREAFKFLQACSLGYCFLTRVKPRSFVAYLPTFKPESNQVILDATADLSGLYPLLGGSLAEGVPTIDYSNLNIHHMEPPKVLRNIRQVVEKRSLAVEYGEWIKRAVLDKTVPGDRVLIVVHKAMVSVHDLLPYRPLEPDLELIPGRSCNVIWWGQGIGSNHYKDCTQVFMFSEFYQPRRAAVAKTLGAKSVRADSSNLEAIQGKLKGDFLSVYEGDILRWTKQLASRGNVRNIDQDGVCGHMNLYTSMDFQRLIGNVHRLFPGAKTPERNLKYSSDDQAGGRRGLVDFLSTSNLDRISFKDLAFMVGIKSGDIRREFNTSTVKPVLEAYTWIVKTSKELSIQGKGLWLVKRIT